MKNLALHFFTLEYYNSRFYEFLLEIVHDIIEL
jgi:hypothetical protein